MSAASRTEAFLREVLSRVVWIREELDPIARENALEHLEDDLVRAIEWLHELDVYVKAA